MFRASWLLAAICALHSQAMAGALEWEKQGSLSFETRAYDDDGESETKDAQLSLFGDVDFETVLYDQETEVDLKIGALFRDAYLDQSRDYIDLNDSYLRAIRGEWLVSLGSHTFNWGVLEMFTAVDTLNPRNYDNTTDTERLGLPSLLIEKEFESSLLQAILILKSKSPKYPQGLNRQGLQIDFETSGFANGDLDYSDGSDLFQFALRYKKNFEKLELALIFQRKYDTTYPLFNVEPNTLAPVDAGDFDIRPIFFPVSEYGASASYNIEEWITKLEASYLNFDNFKTRYFAAPGGFEETTQKDHARVAMGAERAYYYDNNHSGSFYAEITNIFGVSDDEAMRLGAFQRDMGIGYRHQFNDLKGHESAVFLIHDLMFGNENLFQLSHEFRLTPVWKFEGLITIIDAPKPDKNDLDDNIYGLMPLRDSDNILISLSRYF